MENEVRVNESNDYDIQLRRRLYKASNFTTNEQNNYAALRDWDDFNESEPTMGAGAKVEHEITLLGATIGSGIKNTSDLHLNEEEPAQVENVKKFRNASEQALYLDIEEQEEEEEEEEDKKKKKYVVWKRLTSLKCLSRIKL